MKYRILIIFIFSLVSFAKALGADTKQERNYIVEGNKFYNEKRYSEAETMYKKALTVSPSSEAARYNLAVSLIRQSGSSDPNNGNTPLDDAIRLLNELQQTATDALIAERAAYNLGNISFNRQDYKQAIEQYKNALRKNPNNDLARQNLRLAQKKLQEQQNQDNKNQDRDKDKNQDQQQKQEQQNQQNQQNNQQQQDKDKQDQQQNQQQQDKDKQSQQPPQQRQSGGISDENAQKILKAMENEEAATRKRVEAKKQRADNARRRQVTRPW